MVKVKVYKQGKQEPNEIIVNSADLKDTLKDAHSVLNREKVDALGNPVPGFWIGEGYYYRALDIVSIEVEEVVENDG